jgi:hypothetical protein
MAKVAKSVLNLCILSLFDISLLNEIDDFVDISEACSHYCVGASVIDSDAACFRIVEGRARETYIRNISCALIESLRMEEVRACSCNYLPWLLEVEEGCTERIVVSLACAVYTVVEHEPSL